MSEWALGFVLPNVHLSEPIEGVEVALVPRRDQRIIDLETSHGNLGAFLKRFTDAFEVRVEPTALLVRSDAPRSVYTTEALAGFRDLVAISVIPQNRSWDSQYSPQHRILWSDTFALSMDLRH
jgi:hypothetical protein